MIGLRSHHGLEDSTGAAYVAERWLELRTLLKQDHPHHLIRIGIIPRKHDQQPLILPERPITDVAACFNILLVVPYSMNTDGRKTSFSIFKFKFSLLFSFSVSCLFSFFSVWLGWLGWICFISDSWFWRASNFLPLEPLHDTAFGLLVAGWLLIRSVNGELLLFPFRRTVAFPWLFCCGELQYFRDWSYFMILLTDCWFDPPPVDCRFDIRRRLIVDSTFAAGWL